MRALAALALPAAACGFFWNAGNVPGLEKDVADQLAPHGVSATPSCHMLGTTRNGVCTLDMDAVQVSAVVSGLGLKPASARALPGGHQAWESPTGCRAEPGFAESSGPTVYTSARRDAAIPEFEFWILYVDHAAGRVCIELSYAYG